MLRLIFILLSIVLASKVLGAEYNIDLTLKCKNPKVGQPCSFTFSVKKGEEPFLVSSRNIEKTFLGCRSKELAFFGIRNLKENENNSDYLEGEATLIFLKSFAGGIKSTVIKKEDIAIELIFNTKVLVEDIEDVSSPNFYSIGNNLKLIIIILIFLATVTAIYIYRKTSKPKKIDSIKSKKQFFDEVRNKSDLELLVSSLKDRKKVLALKPEFAELFNMTNQIQYKREIRQEELEDINKKIRDLKKEWK